MSTITLTSCEYNALLANASKNDVRFYLNGICIDTEHKCAVATDGNALLKIDLLNGSFVGGEYPDTDNGQIIYATTKKAPKNGEVKIDTETDQFEFITARGFVKETLRPMRIDGKFPDYHRVLIDVDKGAYPKVYPAFNPRLISRTAEALDAPGVQLAFAAEPTEASPMQACFGFKYEHCTAIVMPMRRF